MPKKILMQGNEACVEGAIAAGMRFFAGYPITPSTEVAETSAVRLPQVGGHFVQMEDEIASIACAIGASTAGAKAMTATSGPGFSLKQENLGYACLAEIPLVVVDVQRSGPSTGLPTSPSQGDVMMTRWGTHGDHPIIVISPSSVKETYELAIRCFNLAEKYRQPVIFLMDEMVGHLREGVEIPENVEIVNRPTVEKPTAKLPAYHVEPGQLVPAMAPFGHGQRYNISGLFSNEKGFPTNSNQIADQKMQRIMHKISDNYDDIVQVEQDLMDDAEVAVFCYGGTTRAAITAVEEARAKGIKAGLFRPITIWPFADRELDEVCGKVKKIVVAEHNYGQLLHEVERVAKGRCEISFIGKVDGTVITPDEILAKIEEE
ncbi:MAG: 2-oxoacid:acceptor oxidoreductase subunit alpha [Firmicutes bacterium]|nr:2-oxoacid:acceptor oxidoreductase subunit alpha [Bacillota bacterium]MBQ4372202.1 2-oxoacid:acceptor oxidoreductase subunit alpha [Bacillota bacterium]